MSRLLPLTLAGMLAVNGVGQYKLAAYGDEFLAVIRAWRAARGEDVDMLAAEEEQTPATSGGPVGSGGDAVDLAPPLTAGNENDAEDESASSGRKRGDSRRETAALLARGLSLAEVMEARGLKAGSILRHMEELAQEGVSFEPAQFMRPERYDYACNLFKLCADTRLTPVVERSRADEAVTAGHAPVDFDEAHLTRILMASEANKPK